MLLMIDNYDSFTYNLVQYFKILGQEVCIYAHDEISISMIETLAPDHIVISPGPKAPQDAGVSLAVIKHFYTRTPILGVCLGHQCIAEAFGGVIVPAHAIMHGKTSLITHQGQGLFRDLPSPFIATRYHSLMVDENTLPSVLRVDAWTEDTIMAITHRIYPVYGIQFHPEAILTEHGLLMLQHFCATVPI